MKKSLDDVLKKANKELENAVSSSRHDWEGTTADDVYDVNIHIWRKPGMGNSIQTIIGNQLSILTATNSFLATLLIQNILDEETLDEMVKMAKMVFRNGSKNEKI